MQSVPCLDHLIISHQLKESQGRGEQLGFINQHQPVIESPVNAANTGAALQFKKKMFYTAARKLDISGA